MDWHLVFRYDGTDWIAAGCSLASIILLGSKKRSGFIFYMLACIAGLFYSAMARSLPMVILNIALIALSVRGFLRWEK